MVQFHSILISSTTGKNVNQHGISHQTLHDFSTAHLRSIRGLKGPHHIFECRRTNIIGTLVQVSSHIVWTFIFYFQFTLFSFMLGRITIPFPMHNWIFIDLCCHFVCDVARNLSPSTGAKRSFNWSFANETFTTPLQRYVLQLWNRGQMSWIFQRKLH